MIWDLTLSLNVIKKIKYVNVTTLPRFNLNEEGILFISVLSMKIVITCDETYIYDGHDYRLLFKIDMLHSQY